MTNDTYHHGDLKNALIQAGVNILARDGIGALSLRSVARQAGVSHSAPYAHFSDKQALIAAISTEGFHRLHAQLEAASAPLKGQPQKQITACARAYLNFAVQERDIFNIMFSGILEQEKAYPEFVEISKATSTLLADIVRSCQQAGIFPNGQTDLLVVAIWGQLHGIVTLALEKQISHTVLDQYALDEILLFALNQFALVELT
jgi:AcrR family transcriptional regulator